ncbi:MAG: hypothetical protein RBR53_06405 [Desulforegulaceae bacterium]|nr:hypothetical protein [Desulforegulaceae bacterium]
MKFKEKIFLSLLMWVAFVFGFTHHLIPPIDGLHFDRLHIFLFNLSAGGVIIYSYTLSKPIFSKNSIIFILISLIFAFAAFTELYILAIICAFSLSVFTEAARIKKFGFFPWMFFNKRIIVHRKFHNAAILCLSLGLLISGLVMINNEFIHFVKMDKLELNTFFLGFSFPLSLITMCVMFKLTGDNRIHLTRVLKNIGFWTVNLGVIIFFIFILFELFIAQLIIAFILFFSVILIFYVFFTDKFNKQQRAFLVSGMCFLLFTGVSGIAYIALEMTSYYSKENSEILLRTHSFASVYGWNLSGLAVLVRFEDFPIELHSKKFIALHWITALIFAPIGSISPIMALLAIVSYGIIIKWIFFSNSENQSLI